MILHKYNTCFSSWSNKRKKRIQPYDIVAMQLHGATIVLLHWVVLDAAKSNIFFLVYKIAGDIAY